jgi:hypothetical protein
MLGATSTAGLPPSQASCNTSELGAFASASSTRSAVPSFGLLARRPSSSGFRLRPVSAIPSGAPVVSSE